jgi:hypothetical protein
MFSAPPVLVEPKIMITDEASPIAQERFDWVTQTPEPSPIFLPKVPFHSSNEKLSSLTDLCSPVWEQMLTRIVTHADILGAAEPSVRHQLIGTLCQPFFDQTIETLCGEISSAGPSLTTTGPLKDGRTVFQMEQGLRLLEEDSTDADNDSAFAALLSSEEDYEVEQSPRLLAFDGDSESPRADIKSQMVCRHWKSKGWCRYESQCKFLHPECKRGICSKSPTEFFDNQVPSRSTRRRGGKNKQTLVTLDSRLFFEDSCDAHPQFGLCFGMQQLHAGLC